MLSLGGGLQSLRYSRRSEWAESNARSTMSSGVNLALMWRARIDMVVTHEMQNVLQLIPTADGEKAKGELSAKRGTSTIVDPAAINKSNWPRCLSRTN